MSLPVLLCSHGRDTSRPAFGGCFLRCLVKCNQVVHWNYRVKEKLLYSTCHNFLWLQMIPFRPLHISLVLPFIDVRALTASWKRVRPSSGRPGLRSTVPLAPVDPGSSALCSDDVWGVQEARVGASWWCRATPPPKVCRAQLSPLVTRLLSDSCRWVSTGLVWASGPGTVCFCLSRHWRHL